jgi:hypothetical protein
MQAPPDNLFNWPAHNPHSAKTEAQYPTNLLFSAILAMLIAGVRFPE